MNFAQKHPVAMSGARAHVAALGGHDYRSMRDPAVSRELTAVLRRRALLRAAFPDDSPLERGRRPIGELRAAVALAHHRADALDDRIAWLVEALVQEADPFSRAVAWDSLLDQCADMENALDAIAFLIRQARVQLTCSRLLDEARRG